MEGNEAPLQPIINKPQNRFLIPTIVIVTIPLVFFLGFFTSKFLTPKPQVETKMPDKIETKPEEKPKNKLEESDEQLSLGNIKGTKYYLKWKETWEYDENNNKVGISPEKVDDFAGLYKESTEGDDKLISSKVGTGGGKMFISSVVSYNSEYNKVFIKYGCYGCGAEDYNIIDLNTGEPYDLQKLGQDFATKNNFDTTFRSIKPINIVQDKIPYVFEDKNKMSHIYSLDLENLSFKKIKSLLVGQSINCASRYDRSYNYTYKEGSMLLDVCDKDSKKVDTVPITI